MNCTVHLVMCVSRRGLVYRLPQLPTSDDPTAASIGERLQPRPCSFTVAGDCNTTPWATLTDLSICAWHSNTRIAESLVRNEYGFRISWMKSVIATAVENVWLGPEETHDGAEWGVDHDSIFQVGLYTVGLQGDDEHDDHFETMSEIRRVYCSSCNRALGAKVLWIHFHHCPTACEAYAPTARAVGSGRAFIDTTRLTLSTENTEQVSATENTEQVSAHRHGGPAGQRRGHTRPHVEEARARPSTPP